MMAFLLTPAITNLSAFLLDFGYVVIFVAWVFARRELRDIRRINGNLCKAIVEANSRWGVAMNALQAERRKK